MARCWSLSVLPKETTALAQIEYRTPDTLVGQRHFGREGISTSFCTSRLTRGPKARIIANCLSLRPRVKRRRSRDFDMLRTRVEITCRIQKPGISQMPGFLPTASSDLFPRSS